MTIQWKKRATNILTLEEIEAKVRVDEKGWTVRGSETLKYRCRGRTFNEFKDAILESCDYGNASMDPILIQLFKSAKNFGTYFLYDGKGRYIAQSSDLKDLEKHKQVAEVHLRGITDEKIELRKTAYLVDREKWSEGIKRAMIDRHKEILLSERRRKEEYAKISDVYGSW